LKESSSETAVDAESANDIGAHHFVIDARRSKFTVQAFATGVLSAVGHNPVIGIRTFSGNFDFDAEALAAHALHFTIRSDSLGVLDDVSDKDRSEMERIMKDQVLDVEKYPEISYKSSAISVTRLDNALCTAAVSGDLSFRGVTRKQSFTVRITLLGSMLRGSGEFTLRQSDFQIKPVSFAGGMLRLKDELKFSFEMVANLQNQGS